MPILKLFEVLLSVKNSDVAPMNRTILPSAPAFAKTPRLTSGRANEAFVLAMTRSLHQHYKYINEPIDNHLKSSA